MPVLAKTLQKFQKPCKTQNHEISRFDSLSMERVDEYEKTRCTYLKDNCGDHFDWFS
jgi:hypothetical protein